VRGEYSGSVNCVFFLFFLLWFLLSFFYLRNTDDVNLNRGYVTHA
jgi:hypothetical protein